LLAASPFAHIEWLFSREKLRRDPRSRGGEGREETAAAAAGRAGGEGGEWVPQNRGWRRDPLYRGDGEGFLVHGQKTESYRGSAGEGFIPFLTVSPILEDFRSHPSVQIEWFKNRRNLLQGIKIVDRNQIFVGLELILCGLGTNY
jgi:hypothetical protein